jgi:hypothetical protein
MAKSTRSPLGQFFAKSIKWAKSRAKRPDYNCVYDNQIDVDYLVALYHAQNGKCALTGMFMETTRGGDWNAGKNPWGCSIDRINPAEGYYIGNVQLACSKWNVVRGKMTMAQWHELGAAIFAASV